MNDVMLQKYIPFDKKEFRPHQENAINQIINSIEDGNRFTILNAPVGVGKALSLDTIIPTDKGFKTIKDIQIGDYVFDGKGKKVRVLNKSQKWISRPCFKVVFKNNVEIIVDEEHEWFCNYKGRDPSDRCNKYTTKQLYQFYQKRDYKAYIPKINFADYTKKEVPIDPYVLGLWLGDGTSTDGRITVYSEDDEIWSIIKKRGFLFSGKQTVYNNTCTKTVLGLKSLLKKNNLINNKHIPLTYLISSYADRIDLISGLIDSDGTIHKNGLVEFDNTNKKVFDALCILLYSVGIYPSIQVINRQERQRLYRLTFMSEIDCDITKLSRYKQRVNYKKRRNNRITIKDIQYVGLHDTMCIQVEGGIYCVTNQYIPTHNSLIGYVTAKYLQENNFNTYFCTGTKILQSQYINDFKDVKTIKGRMNFNCLNEPFFDCSKGMCQSHANYRCPSKPILKDRWEFNDNILPDEPILTENDTYIFYDDPVFDDFFLDDMCFYWKQKIKGIMNPLTMLNYDYLITDSRFVHQLPHRKLLIADEAHGIEKVLMRQLEVSFSPRVIQKETGIMLQEFQNINQWIDQVKEISEFYKRKAKNTDDQIKKKKMQEKYHKFSGLFVLLNDNPDNWIFVKDFIGKNAIYTFKPILVSDYSNLIFGIANHVLLMTGTVLKQDIFARELGIDDFSYIEIPSIIPAKQRPIIKSYVGAMSKSFIDQTMPNMIAKIKEIAEKHYDEKGVLHTYTYEISRRIREAFANDDRYIFHNSKNKEEKFNDFKADKTNKILVSPVAFEGIDFPYDQARWQCICKEPFPNMRDPQISVRDSVDYDWVFRQRCLVLSQIYGRSNRAPDDWSITYLLDSRLDTLLGPSSLVTDYFLEALDGLRYDDKLVLNENAYDKLTKDNARKTHEFDREVERNILDDISNGFDTLSSLRKEYKKFPSDAYKYITPAVERLLKHGAIRYES